MSERSLRVALVTPFAWGIPSAVNHHVAGLARGLLDLGHRPVVVASSDSTAEVRRMRRLHRRRDRLVLSLLDKWEAGSSPADELLPIAGTGALEPFDGVPVVPLGRSFPLRVNRSVANIGLPVDVMSRLEPLLAGGGFDVVHVHEPFAPSLSFTALREAHSPVVSTFHLSPAALIAYELGQSILSRFYERVDARIVTYSRAADVLGGLFPGEYGVISPGTHLRRLPAAPQGRRAGMVLYVFRSDDRRGLRCFFRALSAIRPSSVTKVVVAVHRPSGEMWPPTAAARRIRALVSWQEFEREEELASVYAEAAVTILPFLGSEWLPATATEGLATGCPLAGPDLPVARSFVQEGAGMIFSPYQEASLAQVLARLAEEGPSAPAGVAEQHHFTCVARKISDLYSDVLRSTRGQARGHHPRTVRSRGPLLDQEGWIHSDLHVHTSHSKDCTSSVEAVLNAAVEVGLGALAITDHNTIAGALRARDLAPAGMIVIVGEEVKSQQGEVIGLFLSEPIPQDLSFEETLSLIKGQGGLVYVPHPFDRLRTTPSYRSLVDNLHRIDVMETYNARVAFSAFNVNAERFASKYNLAAGAGSDAHVLPGLGTAMLRMPRFEGPYEFLAALRQADIVTRRKSLLYLQSLKLLQTTLDHVLPGGRD